MRDYAALISEANGNLSREEGVAAVALKAGQIVVKHPGQAANPGATPPVPAIAVGYHPYPIAGSTAGSIAVNPAKAAAGAAIVVIERLAEIKDVAAEWPADEDDKEAAIAALKAKNIVVR
jgi:hypothetical protein